MVAFLTTARARTVMFYKCFVVNNMPSLRQVNVKHREWHSIA